MRAKGEQRRRDRRGVDLARLWSRSASEEATSLVVQARPLRMRSVSVFEPAGPRGATGFVDRWFPQIAVTPALLLMILVFVIPLAVSLYLSFQGWAPGQPASKSFFVGLENYELLLNEPRFWWSMSLTLGYTFLAVVLEILLGFAIALLLHVQVPLIGFFRALIILPMMMTPIVAALAWKLLLDPVHGVINYLIGQHIVWLGQPWSAFAAVTLVNIWQNTPYVAVLLLAGLRTLPAEPFEAARIDGASAWQTLKHVTLPLMRPFILVALLIRIIFEFRAFDNIYVMTGGGPADATMLLSVFTYVVTFSSFDLGMGAAASWIMLLVAAAICALFIQVLRGNRRTDA
jgi:multiple sugar transport system permease protein